jgi:hypothetical protein
VDIQRVAHSRQALCCSHTFDHFVVDLLTFFDLTILLCFIPICLYYMLLRDECIVDVDLFIVVGECLSLNFIVVFIRSRTV